MYADAVKLQFLVLFSYIIIDVKNTQRKLSGDKHMPIEIVPAGSTAVVTESHHKHPDNWDLSTEMQRDFKRVTNQADRNEASRTVQGALTDSTVKSSELNTQKAVDYSSKETMLRADGHFEKGQKQISDFYAASLLDSAKNAAALSIQSQLESSALGVQATNNFNLLGVQAVQLSNQADISRQKFAYEGQLQAQIIAAAAAAKAAECCCELKTAILVDGQKTRDLLNSITEQNLRDRAQRSESVVAAYFAAKVAPTSPVS